MLITNANSYVRIFFRYLLHNFKIKKGFFFFLLMFGLSWRSVRIKINNLFTHLIFLYLAFGTVRYAGWNLDLHICCYFEGN